MSRNAFISIQTSTDGRKILTLTFHLLQKLWSLPPLTYTTSSSGSSLIKFRLCLLSPFADRWKAIIILIFEKQGLKILIGFT
jgi:hypothetical protein